MKADISNAKERASFSVGNYREKELCYGYKCILKESGRSLIDLRIYCARSMSYGNIYAVIWTKEGIGKGRAGGYGYDKKSAAVGSAISDAGIKLDKNIGGGGESAIQEALEAIMEAYGYNRKEWLLVEFYA